MLLAALIRGQARKGCNPYCSSTLSLLLLLLLRQSCVAFYDTQQSDRGLCQDSGTIDHMTIDQMVAL